MSLIQALPAALADPVRQLRDDFSGNLGLYVHDLQRNEEYGVDAGVRFRAASTIKLFVLWELMKQASEGRLSLDEEVVMAASDRVIGSGVISDLTPGLKLSLRDAATLMITVSDNTATNLVIERLGTRNVNRTARAAGFAGTHLAGKLFKGRGIRSLTTPADLGGVMTAVARGKAVGRSESRAMLGILKREQYANIVGRMIPHDPWATGKSAWTLASKSGSLRRCRNDAAYVRSPEARYSIALMSDGCDDERPYVDNEAVVCLARIAALVHQHCSRPR